ncbi:MAG: 50S ribosomal protein L4, partial [Nanoarchaeota archaeon]
KYFEAEKKQQPFAPFLEAGKHHSASGNIRHGRRLWKTAYGKGISRVPRKIMWNRGSQFYWIGAEISSARGGRRSHPPKISHFLSEKRLNKKEKEIAIKSGISATANIEIVKRRYPLFSMDNSFFGIESECLKLKTQEFLKLIEKIFEKSGLEVLKGKNSRSGKGKMRNRRKKENAGVLIVTGKDEAKKANGIDIIKLNELKAADLYPLGRLAIYTEKAIEELGGRK